MRGRELPRIVRTIGKAILGAPFLALFLGMLLGPPVAVVLETIDLIRMREQAPGIIDAVLIERGGKGTSRADIAYHFHAVGRRIDSRRLMPGFLGNHGRWTGGGRLARRFPAGAQTIVHYSRSHPELCALEYGWFAWSAAPTLLWIGGATFGAATCLRAGYWQSCISYTGRGTMVYAFGLIFLGPSVVRVRELPWHFFAWFSAVLGAALYVRLRRIKTPQQEA